MLCATLATIALGAIELDKPFVVKAGGKPIEFEIGHASPIFVDFDGDGKRDLLVGQFGDGRLKIFKNVGSDTAPKFDSFTLFKAGGEVASADAG